MDKRDEATGRSAGFHLSVTTYIQRIKLDQRENSRPKPGQCEWGWGMDDPAVGRLAAEGRINMCAANFRHTDLSCQSIQECWHETVFQPPLDIGASLQQEERLQGIIEECYFSLYTYFMTWQEVYFVWIVAKKENKINRNQPVTGEVNSVLQ